MRMNTNIAMMGQPVDVVGSMGRGAQAAGLINQVGDQNAMRNALAQHGAGLVQGDQGAVNALAGLDPSMVLNAQNAQSTMREREAAGQRDEQRLRLAFEASHRQGLQLSMQMSAQQRAQEAAQLDQALAAATTAQSPEEWDRIMSGFGEQGQQFVGQFERRGELIAGAMGLAEALKMQQGPEAPAAFRTLEMRAEAANLQPGTPEHRQFMLEGSAPQTNVTVNTGEAGPRTGTIPPGMMLVDDPSAPGGLRMAPIAGGPVEMDAAQAEDQSFRRDQQRARAGSTVIQDLQRARDLLPELGAIARRGDIAGGVTRTGQARIPGTVANRITQFTESALSNVGLDTLQQMRENSPTGGALGQVPIQQQQRLEQVLGSLRIDQPPDVLEANIKRVMNIYTDIIYGTAAERERAVEQGRMSPQQSREIDGFYHDLPFDERGRPVEQGARPVQQSAPRAVNPQTGETLEWDGQQWRPAP